MSRLLLVTGASGLLGSSLAVRAQAAGWQVVGTYHRRRLDLPSVEMRRLDLPQDAASLLTELQPAAVVHTAYSRDPAELWRVIVAGSAAIARACRSTGARLIHISSDAVFAGRPEPYVEEDQPEPIHLYAAAKAAAEPLVHEICPEALQIRTSLLYSPPGAERPDPNLLMAQKLLEDPAQGCLFTDEVRSPLCVDDLAQAIVELLDRDIQGMLHIAGPIPLSRFQFGRLLLLAAGRDPTGLPSGSAQGFRRPSRVVLDSERALRLLKSPLRSPYAVLGEDHEPTA